MASLYRCRARVAYRPARSNNLIVFEEKQIQELIVKLKWQPNLAFSSADASTSASIATNALSQSSCSVTVSDPYLVGLAWPALYDASSLYNVSNIAASNNITLPACTETQDPRVDKCYRYTEFVPDQGDSPGGWAFLIISLWYDIGGGSFGSDYYFKVQSLAISHGSKYPAVTIRGVEARSVLFNQSLVNLGFEENLPVNEALKRITKSLGYEAEFCVSLNPSQDPELDAEKRLPRSFRFKGVTHAEAMSRLINTTGGNMLSLPTKEYAKKISICSRADINQGCSVFYLGKGLYEGYEINGALENGLLPSNLQTPGISANNSDPYVSSIPKAKSYTIQDILPEQKKQALKTVKKLPFPLLFTNCKPKCTTREFDGVVWKVPRVRNKEGAIVTSESLKGFNLRGVAPNGTNAISFLSGKVEEGTSTDSGRVTIKTDFYLRVKITDQDNKEQSFDSVIFQESTNLSNIKVKAQDRVSISQSIGTSTNEKPEFTRFYIKGNAGEFITIDPQLVWQYALSSVFTPIAARSKICLRMGSSGSSTGSHLHAEWGTGRGDTRPITAEQVRKYLDVDGDVSSTYRSASRPDHKGVDIVAPLNTPICLKEGVSIKEIIETKCPSVGARGISCGAGKKYGNSVVIQTPEGPMLLAHLALGGVPPEAIPGAVSGGVNLANGGNTQLGAAAAPGINGLNVETMFKGIPRALRIIPGRTILSFISDYDEWIEGGRKVDGPDPGIWIASKYKNWMINQCDFKWREGDLKVSLEGVSAWGNQVFKVPAFDKFMSGIRADRGKYSTSSQYSDSYYDYIRAPGPLSWVMEDGKDSTEVLCDEAQTLSNILFSSGDDVSGSTSPTSVNSTFPTAKCSHPNSVYNEVIKALATAGVKTKEAYAGVLGNMAKESYTDLDWNVHNTSRASSGGCSATPSKVLGTFGYGLVQWCGSRADELATKYQCGRNCNLNQQLSFLGYELKKDYSGTIARLNSAKSAADAASIFRKEFERPNARDEADRRALATQIFSKITCQ